MVISSHIISSHINMALVVEMTDLENAWAIEIVRCSMCLSRTGHNVDWYVSIIIGLPVTDDGTGVIIYRQKYDILRSLSLRDESEGPPHVAHWYVRIIIFSFSHGGRSGLRV